jgi:hypothetical protein
MNKLKEKRLQINDIDGMTCSLKTVSVITASALGKKYYKFDKPVSTLALKRLEKCNIYTENEKLIVKKLLRFYDDTLYFYKNES